MPTVSSTSIKISFIVPAYNVAPYLKECVKSISSQTYPYFEIIIVNDGSTDNTELIANELAAEDDRIFVINQNNGGLSCARNTGLNNAKGDWIIFVDSDDFWIGSESLQLLINEIKKYPNLDFLGFNCSYYFPSTNTLKQWVRYDDSLNEIKTGKECISSLVKSGTFPMSACSKIIRTQFLLDNNIKFINGIYSEDIPWFIELLKQAKGVKFINHYIYGYRKEVPGSISTTFSLKKFTDLFNIIRQGIDHTDKQDKSLMSFWAYELCILIGMLTFVTGSAKRKYYGEIRSIAYLLKYTENPKVKLVANIRKLFGFRSITFLLGIFIRTKVKQ